MSNAKETVDLLVLFGFRCFVCSERCDVDGWASQLSMKFSARHQRQLFVPPVRVLLGATCFWLQCA